MSTFADRIIDFNSSIQYHGKLPDGIRIMNPFEDPHALEVSSLFYRKYYGDSEDRFLILGINPGRFGAGLTGVPFTDPKRLWQECGISFEGKMTHEPSATFIYEMINAFGGPISFYKNFYIHSVCPLGFTLSKANGKEVNYNYYDSAELTECVMGFILENIRKQIEMGVSTEVCFCFGTGKNESFLNKINQKYGFFKKIVALEHPRFIMQYKAKRKEEYVQKYLNAFAKYL